MTGNLDDALASKLELMGARKGKSGLSKGKLTERAKRSRDQEIYDYLREMRKQAIAISLSPELLEDELPVVAYGEYPYPIIHDMNNKRMMEWDDLSSWMKIQLIIMAMNDLKSGFMSFTIKVPVDLEKKWTKEGRNPTSMMRDRFRKQFDRNGLSGIRFFFVMEGSKDRTREETRLHCHGGVFIPPHSSENDIKKSLNKVGGKGVKGTRYVDRDVYFHPYNHKGPAWAKYMFKNIDVRDRRLIGNRVAMSRSATRGAKAYWNLITGRK